MREFPQGTVTLLFTDIEGSTSLLQRVGERYADVLKGADTFCARRSINITATRLIPRAMPSSSPLRVPPMLSQQQ